MLGFCFDCCASPPAMSMPLSSCSKLPPSLLPFRSVQPMSSLEVVEQLVKEVEELVGSSTTTTSPPHHPHRTEAGHASATDLATSSMPRTPKHDSSELNNPGQDSASHDAAEAGPSQLPHGGAAGSRAARGHAPAGQQPATAVAAGSAMLQLTRAALDMWQRMGSGASTPSTVMPFTAPHTTPASGLQTQQQTRRSQSPVGCTANPLTTEQQPSDAELGIAGSSVVGQKRRAEDA